MNRRDKMKEEYHQGKIKAVCTNDDECGCIPADLWCIVDGRICPHLQLGFKNNIFGTRVGNR